MKSDIEIYREILNSPKNQENLAIPRNRRLTDYAAQAYLKGNFRRMPGDSVDMITRYFRLTTGEVIYVTFTAPSELREHISHFEHSTWRLIPPEKTRTWRADEYAVELPDGSVLLLEGAGAPHIRVQIYRNNKYLGKEEFAEKSRAIMEKANDR